MGENQREADEPDEQEPPRVFVTYSHDSEEHKDLVLRFCTFLRVEVGVDAHLDRWYEDVRRDWTVWAIQQLAVADFILVVASPGYRRRVDGSAAPGEGRGAQFEGAIIRDNLMRNLPAETRRVLPVVLPGRAISEIPTFLHAYSSSRYVVSDFTVEGIGDLLAVLTGVPRHPMPPRGRFVVSSAAPWRRPFGRVPMPVPRSVTAEEPVRRGGTPDLTRAPDLRTIAVAAVAVGLVGLAGLAWTGGQPATIQVVAASSLVLVATVLFATLMRRRVGGGAESWLLDRVSADLANAVRNQWRAEERFRRLQDPVPIQTRWGEPTRPGLQDHWANIVHGAGGPHEPRPRDLSGRLAEIADVFASVSSQRLVVLGDAGGGKTILALRLTLDLLDRRTEADPVPVLFSLVSWNPNRQSLHDWMAARLVADHPGLATLSARNSTAAGELVRAGRVLPILDGLDEIPSSLRAAAIRRMNATLHPGDPLVVTCRTGEYAAAVAEADVITAAAVIELRPLGMDDLADYLPRTARVPADATSSGKWDQVITHLRRPGRQDHAAALMSVLSVPLMTSLARTAYSDTAADPVELLQEPLSGSKEAIANHLVDQLIPTAYDELISDRSRWSADQARQWLGHLAGHVDTTDERAFAWWRLHQAVPRAVQTAVAVVVGAIGAGGPAGLLAERGTGVLVGAVAGLTSGLVSVSSLPVPSTVRLRVRGGLDRLRQRIPPRSTPVGWLAAATVLSLTLWFTTGPNAAAMAGVAVVAAFGLDTWFDVPADVGRAVGPRSVLRADRLAALSRGVARGCVIGIAVGLMAGAVAGVGFGLGVIVVSVAYTSWGRFAVARIWLALSGRLPWRLMAFLDDAHRRGVLRQVGGVYQFRHATLQDRLRATVEEMV